MKEIMKLLGIALVVIILNCVINSVIFWGIGRLIVWIFKIDYSWTLLHGFACTLVWVLLKELFSKEK